MTIDFAQLNVWAILVAALATFFLGGLWYTALFGKAWQKMHGYSDEKLKEMQTRRPPTVFFAGLLVCYLVVAAVLATLVAALDLRTAAAGATLGLLTWVGLAAAIQMTGHLSQDKPWGAYLIDLSYQLIYLIGMGALLAVWR